MFQKKDLGVIDWWIFFILMAIPLVNIIVLILLLLSKDTNQTLKNYIKAIFLPAIIIFGLFIVFGGLAAFSSM